MKLLSSVRGSGLLSTEEGEAEVAYQMDTYEERSRRSVSGSLEGDMSFAQDKGAARLKLATGEDIKVTLIKPDGEGADFQGA